MGTGRVHFPLDTLPDDNLGALMQQLGANLPRNAEMERKETGRREKKLPIGGKSYYCGWMGHEAVIRQVLNRPAFSLKIWRRIDVPLDGIVRSEQDSP